MNQRLQGKRAQRGCSSKPTFLFSDAIVAFKGNSLNRMQGLNEAVILLVLLTMLFSCVYNMQLINKKPQAVRCHFFVNCTNVSAERALFFRPSYESDQ